MAKELKEDFSYPFEVKNGIYLIEIAAKAKSWWQNLKQLKSFLKDDDIILRLDNSEIFISTSKDKDVKAIWNGNELKGLSKTVLIAIPLKEGKHTLHFKPDQSPILENISILELEEVDNNAITYSPSTNNPPEKGDRRPWISYVFQNLAIKELNITALADKKGRDDEDIKLIINGKIEKNENKNSHRDWYWCGKILKGKELTFKKEVNFTKSRHSIELWADNTPRLKEIKINFLTDSIIEYKKITLKPYKYRGVKGRDDYNRYDEYIIEAVDFWNKEFLKDTDPLTELLDPNLVKAMIYQESNMGYNETAGINVMQVGKLGDPSIKTLRGEFKEYWIHDGREIPLKYDAEVKNERDSIFWGVRWLYHKAQWINISGKRRWMSWKDAVRGYGPPEKKYAEEVWNIYKNGYKKEKDLIIQLWSIAFFALLIPASISQGLIDLRLKLEIENITINPHQFVEAINIQHNQIDKAYFLAQIEWDENWWEELKVGRLHGWRTEWFDITDPPTEQAILSANFLNLQGFNNPLIEVYGLTHMWHGGLYVYEIKDGAINLLFQTTAVDLNPDTRYAPDNFEKYGYSYCGEIFSGGKLISKYEDINQDGNLDLILSGTKKIICEEKDENYNSIADIIVDSIPIEIRVLWDKDKQTWVDITNN